MAINLTDLIKSLNFKITQGTGPSVEQTRFTIASNRMATHYNAIFYSDKRDFQTADSDNAGQIIYNEDSDRYYLSFKNDWVHLNITDDSAVDQVDDRFGGVIAGFNTGGVLQTGSQVGIIDRIPFANDLNTVQTSNLTKVSSSMAGQSSTDHGYASGGDNAGITLGDIEKFNFASGTDATIIGQLTEVRSETAGHNSPTEGFTSAGINPATGGSTVIDKFLFASDGNASPHVSIFNQGGGPSPNAPRGRHHGYSSLENGYVVGGYAPPLNNSVTRVDRFLFSYENAPQVITSSSGALSTGRSLAAGISSAENGYTAGGFTFQSIDDVEKSPFATNSPHSSVGTLAAAKRSVTDISSTTHGYVTGGFVPALNTVERFPYAVEPVVITDLGDLTIARFNSSGQQY